MYRSKSGKIVVENVWEYIGILKLQSIFKNKHYDIYFYSFILPTIFVKDYYLPKGCWYL